jgi:cytochrome c553
MIAFPTTSISHSSNAAGLVNVSTVMKRSVVAAIAVSILGVWQNEANAQVVTQRVIHLPPRPLSTTSDPLVPPGTPGFAPTPVVPPRVQVPTPAPAHPVQTIPSVQPAAQIPMPAGILAWDADMKEATVGHTQSVAELVFYFTNVSPSEVTINHVGTSCGCTVPRLPTMPWKLPAGTNGVLPVAMTVAGKSGMVFKTLTINTDKGWKMLSVKTTILPPPAIMTGGNREQNQLLAKADRQAVFKGDCASCHVEKAIGKVGKDLYDAACGICHEAEHRATMVPDLHALKHDTNAEYWKVWIDNGKEGTLMPAFAQRNGGPLSDQQIASLVDHLVKTIPGKASAALSSPVFPSATTAAASPAGK